VKPLSVIHHYLTDDYKIIHAFKSFPKKQSNSFRTLIKPSLSVWDNTLVFTDVNITETNVGMSFQKTL
jgi:hypothetical protein